MSEKEEKREDEMFDDLFKSVVKRIEGLEGFIESHTDKISELEKTQITKVFYEQWGDFKKFKKLRDNNLINEFLEDLKGVDNWASEWGWIASGKDIKEVIKKWEERLK